MDDTLPHPPALEPTQHRASVVSDQPIESIEVRLVPIGDGRWHKVLNALWDEGVMAAISDRAFRVLGAFLRLRTDGTDTVDATIEQLCRLTGYSKSPVYAGRSELLEPAERVRVILSESRGLLAQIGRDRYQVLGGWSFAARTGPPPADPPDSAVGESRFLNRGRFSPIAENPDAPHSERARANQPEEELVRSGFAPEPSISKESIARYAKARAEGMAGWSGLGLWWTLDGVSCPRLALGMLEIREPTRSAVLEVCKDLTVEEIASVAALVRMNGAVANPAMVLCYRLCKARGRDLPSIRRRGEDPEVERLRRVQASKRRAER